MTKRVVGVLGFVLLGACGGDGGGEKVSSGLPPDAKLSSLDAADASQLCTSMADSFNNMLSDNDMKKIACVVLAAPLSIKQVGGKIEGDVPKCRNLVNRCMSGETISEDAPVFTVEDQFVDESVCEAEKLSANFSSCEANVGEFESCASSMLSALSERFDLFDCEMLSDPEKLMNMDSDGLELESQPKCETLVEKCPTIDFGTEEEASEG